MPSLVLPKHQFAAIPHVRRQVEVSRRLVEAAAVDAAGVYERLATRPQGLTGDEAAARLDQHGPNILARDQRTGVAKLLWHAVLNPLVLLLAVLAVVSFATGDLQAGSVMSCMIVLGVSLRLVQEAKADTAAAKLKRMISVTATVIRDGQPREIAVSRLVPGDVVRLAAGDMIPGDVRLVEAKDLFVNQGTLTHRRMDYSVSRHQNTPIGSGAVESAVRRVINLREEQRDLLAAR